MRRAAKPNITICYDFDGTLIRGNMQENSFLEEVGIPAVKFWKQVKARARKHDMDEVLAYMQLMVEAASSPWQNQLLRQAARTKETVISNRRS